MSIKLDPSRTLVALRTVISDVDYDIHKHLERDEETGDDKYPGLVAQFIGVYNATQESSLNELPLGSIVITVDGLAWQNNRRTNDESYWSNSVDGVECELTTEQLLERVEDDPAPRLVHRGPAALPRDVVTAESTF